MWYKVVVYSWTDLEYNEVVWEGHSRDEAEEMKRVVDGRLSNDYFAEVVEL
jgi:hypothetical protein